MYGHGMNQLWIPLYGSAVSGLGPRLLLLKGMTRSSRSFTKASTSKGLVLHLSFVLSIAHSFYDWILPLSRIASRHSVAVTCGMKCSFLIYGRDLT